jgi:hypothetical protein
MLQKQQTVLFAIIASTVAWIIVVEFEDWKYSTSRLRGLSEREVNRLLGEPDIGDGTVPNTGTPKGAYFRYYTSFFGTHLSVEFDREGRAVRTSKIPEF